MKKRLINIGYLTLIMVLVLNVLIFKMYRMNFSVDFHVSKANASESGQQQVYNKAMEYFQSERYEEAIELFKKIAADKEIAADIQESAIRNMAHCYFFWGMKGERRLLLKATDLYREVIKKFPENREENAEAHFRMAKSYDTLDFSYETQREWNAFINTYSDSKLVPEAIFSLALFFYRKQKLSEAIETFEKYINVSPKGDFVRDAHFLIAESYSRLQQMPNADKWYHEALRRWPSLEEMSDHHLKNLGFHYFRKRQYNEALRVCFLHVNLFAQSENNKEVLFAIASSLIARDEFSLSIKILSGILEAYPDSQEATEAALLMAQMGIEHPNMRLPFHFYGMHHYKDPLRTYNEMLAKTPPTELVEKVLFQKGYALYKYGRYQNSFDTFALLMVKGKDSRYIVEARRYLPIITEFLVREYSSAGDHVAVSDLYLRFLEHETIGSISFSTALTFGENLKRTGLYDEAMDVFDRLYKTSSSFVDSQRALFAMAETEFRRGNIENAERIIQKILSGKTEVRNITAKYNAKSLRKDGIADQKKIENISRQIQLLQGNLYYKRGAYAKAASAYSKALPAEADMDQMAMVYRNYADSLKALNDFSAAIINYQRAVDISYQDTNQYSPEFIASLYQGMGECLFKQGRYQEGIDMHRYALSISTSNLWLLYDLGKGYANIKNVGMLKKTYEELKNKGGEGFWSHLADFALRDFAN